MAVSFIAKSHVNGTLTATEPAGTASGDVLIACLDEAGGVTAHTGPAGWTPLEQSNYATLNVNRGSVWFILRGGSAPSLTWSGPLAVLTDIDIFTYRGSDQTTPIDVHTSAVRASSTTPLSPSVTTNIANDVLLAILFNEEANSTVVTQPSGMTSRQDGFTVGDDIFMADLTLGAAGATGTKQWTLDTGDATWAVALAIAPPSATGVITPGVLSLTLTFFIPGINPVLTPAPLSLVLAFFTPGLKQTLTPGVLALSISFFTPTITVSFVLFPTTLSLTLSFFTPTITRTANNNLTPAILSLTLAFFTPLVSTPQTITPAVLALLLSFFAPRILAVLTGIMPANAGALLSTIPTGDVERNSILIGSEETNPSLSTSIPPSSPLIGSAIYIKGGP